MKPRLPRLICAAGSWGFGPSATLTMVADAIGEQLELDFVGETIALEFVAAKPQRFRRVFNADPLTFDYREYDGMLNVMHAEAAVAAAGAHCQIYGIDNLYWFWRWRHEDINSVALLARSDTSVAEVVKKAKSYDDYHYYSLLYSLSSVVYAPYYGRPYAAIDSCFPGRVKAVTPLVDHRFKEEMPRNLVVVSFSGLFNPLASNENVARYVSYVKKIVRGAIRGGGHGELNVLYAAPERYASQFQDLLRGESCHALDHQSFLQVLNRARVVFAPAGIATTHECAVYGAPLVFLPEQHDGSFPNYVTLLEHAVPTFDPRALYFGIFHSEQYHGGKPLPVHEIYAAMQREETAGPSGMEWAVRIITYALDLTSNEEKVRNWAGQQLRYLVQIFGRFDGINEIAVDLVGRHRGMLVANRADSKLRNEL